MKLSKIIVFVVLAVSVVSGFSAFGQDRATGSIKGKVSVETGVPAGVAVIVRQGEQEITRGLTDKKGEFLISKIPPGRYAVTLRKPGLSVGTIEGIEVKPGKTRDLGSRLRMSIDEGSIAFIRGSVFNEYDRSVPNVRIELHRIESDGSLTKIDGRLTNEIGSFVFRLTPDLAKYRITAKPLDATPVSKDVEVDGAAVYRVALSIKRN